MFAHVKRLGQFPDWLRQSGLGFVEKRLGPGKDDLADANTMIHPLADRPLVQQLFRVSIENKINPSRVNSEMIGLGEKDAVGQPAGDKLMSMPGDECNYLGKFRS